jgi:hypothetical protein
MDPGVVAAGKRKLLEELLQSRLVLGHIGINFAPGAFEIDVADDGGTSVTGAGDVEHVEVVLFNDPVQVDVDEVLARGRAPVPDDKLFNVGQLQRFFQQRIVVEIDLADREVIGRAPVGVHFSQEVRGKRGCVCVHE